MTFNLLFLLKQKFSNGKFDALRESFDQKLISPTMSRDMQKPVFDFQFCLERTLKIVHCDPIWRYANVGIANRKLNNINIRAIS